MTGATLLLIGLLIVGFVIAVGIGIIIKLMLNHHRPRLHIDHNATINITEFDQLAPDERQSFGKQNQSKKSWSVGSHRLQGIRLLYQDQYQTGGLANMQQGK